MPTYKGHRVTHQRLTQARSRTSTRAPWARGGRAMRGTQAGAVSAREGLARRDSPRVRAASPGCRARRAGAGCSCGHRLRVVPGGGGRAGEPAGHGVGHRPVDAGDGGGRVVLVVADQAPVQYQDPVGLLDAPSLRLGGRFRAGCAGRTGSGQAGQSAERSSRPLISTRSTTGRGTWMSGRTWTGGDWRSLWTWTKDEERRLRPRRARVETAAQVRTARPAATVRPVAGEAAQIIPVVQAPPTGPGLGGRRWRAATSWR